MSRPHAGCGADRALTRCRPGGGRGVAGRFGMEIRGADAGDAAGLAELSAAAGRLATPAAMARRLERLQEARALVLLALEWGPPSGVAVVTHRPVLDADTLVSSLDLLWVAPDERRRGVGRLLLKAAAQAARQAGGVELRATADDPATHAFALACGFTERGATLTRPLRKRGD